MFKCQVCGQDIEVGPRVGRRDDCPRCGADLHACRQCRFYEPGAHNDCRETEAELVADKKRANFCDFFQPASSTLDPKQGLSKDEAGKMWDEFFKKK